MKLTLDKETQTPEAGRDLDKAIAELMGYQVIETDECNGFDNFWLSKDGQNVFKDENDFEEELPCYSTEIKAAWSVLEYLAETGHWASTVHFEPNLDFYRVDMHAGDLNCPHKKAYDPKDGHGNSEVMDWDGTSAPHAICLCALKTTRPRIVPPWGQQS